MIPTPNIQHPQHDTTSYGYKTYEAARLTSQPKKMFSAAVNADAAEPF
jgi:hypothetical protein